MFFLFFNVLRKVVDKQNGIKINNEININYKNNI